MSILDPVRNKLAPDIWSPDKKLFPHIKRQVLKGLYSFLKPENIKSIYIVGTIAGYQYSDSSDIDVNIEVNQNCLNIRNVDQSSLYFTLTNLVV